MRILLINKFYYLSGGAERYVFEWERLLKEYGHEVLIFSMKHPRNRLCDQEKFFIEPVSFDMGLSVGAKARAALHSLWSMEARRNLRALLREHGPVDIAHVHSYLYQLTPSIFGPLKDAGVPIVHSCHDFAQVCASQHLWDFSRNKICEDCLTRGRTSPLRRRCIKGSRAASAVGALAGALDRWATQSTRHMDRLIAYSDFVRHKLLQGGIPWERIAHVPHFICANDVEPSNTPGEYMLFFGRLAPYKGIRTFLDAAAQCPDIPCKILGDGELGPEIEAHLKNNNARHIEWLGHREGDEIWRIVRNARAIVVPSEWYEPFGLVILEAMAAARAVIASDLAGPSEILTHEEDGLLVSPGNADALAHAMRALWKDAERAKAMGLAGRKKVLRDYTPQIHYERMMKVFEGTLR